MIYATLVPGYEAAHATPGPEFGQVVVDVIEERADRNASAFGSRHHAVLGNASTSTDYTHTLVSRKPDWSTPRGKSLFTGFEAASLKHTIVGTGNVALAATFLYTDGQPAVTRRVTIAPGHSVRSRVVPEVVAQELIDENYARELIDTLRSGELPAHELLFRGIGRPAINGAVDRLDTRLIALLQPGSGLGADDRQLVASLRSGMTQWLEKVGPQFPGPAEK